MSPWDLAAAVAAAMGIRSGFVWIRRSAGTAAETKPALLSLFVTARVLLWLMLAGWFVLLAHGADSPLLATKRFWWIPGAFFVVLAAQTAASFFLGSDSGRGRHEGS